MLLRNLLATFPTKYLIVDAINRMHFDVVLDGVNPEIASILMASTSMA